MSGRKTGTVAAIVAVAAILGAGLIACPQLSPGGSSSPRYPPSGTPVTLGVSTEGVPDDPRKLDDYIARVGRSPGIVMWYASWTQRLIDPTQLDAVAARGSIPMITWEPWDDQRGVDQPDYALRTIARGDHDPYLRQSAAAAAAWDQPLYIRFAHEMNGSWYPWGRSVNGNSSTEYIQAWQHVVTIFREGGAAKVRWVWSPQADYQGKYPFEDLFPGDGWLDWVGLDGYNWGSTEPSGWRSFRQIFGDSYRRLVKLSSRPAMISETASAEVGGDKAAWIRRAFLSDLTADLPRVRAVVWFDRDKETDWRVNSSKAVLAAFRDVVSSSRFDGGPWATPRTET